MRMLFLTPANTVGSMNQPSPHSGRSAATHHQLSAFLLRYIDVTQHLVVLRTGGHRSDLCVVTHRIAHARSLCERGQLVHKLIVHAVLQQQARAGDTGLARGGEDTRHRAVHRVLEIGVAENDIG
jgi:hypothetical protein